MSYENMPIKKYDLKKINQKRIELYTAAWNALTSAQKQDPDNAELEDLRMHLEQVMDHYGIKK